MTGLNRTDMQVMTADAHLAQSVQDILSTPIGTRVLQRDYGSDLPELIDNPMNGETVVDVYVAVAEALSKWEPRLNVTRIQIEEATAGQAVILIKGETVDGDISLSAELGIAA